MKLDDAILTVFATHPAGSFDAADVLTILEDRTGREYRLSAVFNRMLDLAKSGSLVVDRKEGARTLYRLAAFSLQKDTAHG